MRIIKSWSSEGKKCLDKILNQEICEDRKVYEGTKKIINDVVKNKDKAVFKYCEMFDGVKTNKQNVRVSSHEIKIARTLVSKDFLKALSAAKQNITKFHEKQLRKQYSVGYLKAKYIPIDSVGIYVPGGKAVYPSTLLMTGIPAKIAGVKRIVICTPSQKDLRVNPNVLVSADLVGINEIYKIGGVQAIAAMAYGTETVKPVDKIVGPGNIYVTMAKKIVFGKVGIESLAGPSEILIIADKYANADFIAADLLSQAEHDENASCLLVTDSLILGCKVLKSVDEQKKYLRRKKIIGKSLLKSYIIVVRDFDEAVRICNIKAPEHLQVMVRKPSLIVSKIRNAGSIFIGEYSPVVTGDYIAGVNHVLPTLRGARFSSSLGVDDFVKRVNYVYYSKDALSNVSKDILEWTKVEGLDAHGKSVTVRIKR
ncbi:MAG: histidinol dehydrogenase [Candidatus Firestonebacteria bacterium]